MKQLLLILMFIMTTSCVKNKPKQKVVDEIEYKSVVINAKAIVKQNNNDNFMVSFDDGSDMNCKFGEFHKYNVGDTISFQRKKNSFFNVWQIIIHK